MKLNIKSLLLLDALTAFTSAMVLFIFYSPLASFLNLTPSLLLWLGGGSVFFAFYSGGLFFMKRSSDLAIYALIFGNFLWVILCLYLAFFSQFEPNFFGKIFFMKQALFVFLLAILQFVSIRDAKTDVH